MRSVAEVQAEAADQKAAAAAEPTPTIQQALSRVMEAVGAVRKGDRNAEFGFNFRGIDAVVNAVSPALREHGVIVVPEALEVERTTVEVGRNRTLMGHVAVRVRYTFLGPAGDAIVAVVPGEAMDSGDKATAKAMSVAFRTALLQTLALPTDEPDPDASVYERAPRVAHGGEVHVNGEPPAPPVDERPEHVKARAALATWAEHEGIELDEVLLRWAEQHDGQHIGAAEDADALRSFHETWRAERAAQAAEA